MAAQQNPGKSTGIGSVPNLRDLGGWPTRDGGSVRPGLLYRSSHLHELADEDLQAFAGLGVHSVYDLRTEAERGARPDRLPEGSDYTVLDVLADSTDAAPARLLSVLTDPKAAKEMLGGGRATELFERGYREVVSLPSARTAYRRLFIELAQPAHRPALFHCTTGKDRTGWAAAAILLLLGVSDRLVMEEYLLTNQELLPAEQPVFDAFEAQGGDPALLRPVIGVEQSYLEAALDEMAKQFGTIERYFSAGLGLDADAQGALRNAFVAGS